MGIGALTQYIDVPQVVLYAFWIFFFGLLYYLRREDKREGYPLESERSGNIRVQGWPAIPPPKIFKLRNGGTYEAPPGTAEKRDIRAVPSSAARGSPLQPSGDPMADAIGPASYTEREDKPDLTAEGEPVIVPLRVATDFSVAPKDPDPRGMPVVGADGETAGTVTDIWVDRAEPQIRYLEVKLAGANPRAVLLPAGFMRIKGRKGSGRVKVVALLAKQFAGVPAIANPDIVTRREEDRIMGYYAGGHLYAEPSRMGPMI